MDSPNTLDKPRVPPDQLNSFFIPFLEGRPERDTIINKEDILNLKIALNTAKSLQDFFSVV